MAARDRRDISNIRAPHTRNLLSTQMKTFSIYAAMGAGVTNEQTDQIPHPRERVTQAQLCREIVDELIERDMLGVLLSSSHLRRFLAHFSTYAPAAQSQMIRRIILNSDVVDEIHMYLLRTYRGLHIEECAIGSRTELHAALDQKFEMYARDLCAADIRIEMPMVESLRIENERRYRHACHTATAMRSHKG